ncbi:GNAT family N-acetyltransferase [Chloroflexota bacterium]
MTEKTHLDPSLKLRGATRADANAVAELIYIVCEAGGIANLADTPEDLLHEWSKEGFNLETDAFLVETAEGKLVGFEVVFNEKDYAHFFTDGYVHPDFQKRGIGTVLLQSVEERAREMMQLADLQLRVFLQSGFDGKDEPGKALHTSMGYKSIRDFWRMEIELTEEPAQPKFPVGIELRPFNKEKDARLLWEADNEAFREHWGAHDSTFEDWEFRKFERPESDPTLWLIAWAGDQIAGFSLNRYRNNMGWVGTLGVRKPWRKNGLGLALLQRSFHDFYQRGMKIVGLGVDSSNTTGATRLYQLAGMRVANEFVTFEKELRAGSEMKDAELRA